MISLQRKLRKNSNEAGNDSNSLPEPTKRISIRDKLLIKEVQEMQQNLPCSCKVEFEDVDSLHSFTLVIEPDEGFWKGGIFKFSVYVTEEYNIMPPQVKCLTKLWHPNISEEGEICLSLLRPNSIDGLGWAPTRHLKDVVWGLNSLFTDLLNFEDPLNLEAAELYQENKKKFKLKVKKYVAMYASK